MDKRELAANILEVLELEENSLFRLNEIDIKKILENIKLHRKTNIVTADIVVRCASNE